MSRKAWYYSYIALILILVLVTKNVVGVTSEFCNKKFIHLSNTLGVVSQKLYQLQQLQQNQLIHHYHLTNHS